jgi:S1-C subfamily serine protease
MTDPITSEALLERGLSLRASKRLTAASAALTLILSWCLTQIAVPPPAQAVETWEKLDKRLKQEVYQINVGLKLELKEGAFVYLADMSPKYHYPVFSATREDKGYRIVEFGSTFPVKTVQHDKTYFLTSAHVVDSAGEIVKECERFYAAMRLYAEQSGGGNAYQRYKQLLQIVNLANKGKDLAGDEKTLYQNTVDAIWDAYDRYLDIRADPGRVLFGKYAAEAGVQSELGYFLHAPGPVSQAALKAKIYKVAQHESDPDVAILEVADNHVPVLEFDTFTASEGQEIQVIGYPAASDQIDVDAGKYYAPTFSTGRISRVAPHILQVDAPITVGNSGGPVVSLRGKVLGVVAVRAVSTKFHSELTGFGGAVTIQSVQAFAPELFGPTAAR